MAYHGILIQNAVQAANIDTLNRSVIATFDVDNGNVINLIDGQSSTSGKGEVWTASTPVTASLTNLWMAYEPEIVVTVSGSNKFKGIDPDVRNFYNISGTEFSAFQPKVGDILTLSSDALAGTKSTNTYVVAVNNTAKLTWAAAAISGLSLKLLETTYISIADGSIGTQRQTAYKFEVVAVA